jgi:hypothetical protein
MRLRHRRHDEDRHHRRHLGDRGIRLLREHLRREHPVHRRRHRHRRRGNRRHHLRRRDRLDDLRVRLGDRHRVRRAYLRRRARDAPNGSAWHRGWGEEASSRDSAVGHPDREPDEDRPDLRAGDLRLPRDGDRPDRAPDEARPDRVPDEAHLDAGHLVPGVERDARPEPRSMGCCRREEPSGLAWGRPVQLVPPEPHLQQELPAREPVEPALRALEQQALRERVLLPEQQALPQQVQRERLLPEPQRLVPPEASGRDAGRPVVLRDVQPR